MYKVSEVADIIGVEKVAIVEKMITHKTILDESIKKVDGVTYFDERGIDVLRTLFNGNTLHNYPAENHEKSDEIEKSKIKSKFDREREILYNQINILQNEIVNLDQELEYKDEIIKTYIEKIEVDFCRLSEIQHILLKNFERQED